MKPILEGRDTFSGTFSRRRFVSTLAATASVASIAPILGTPVASIAQTPVSIPSDMPHTLAPDASPRFRAVAEAVMAAMTATATPGATLGIFADGHEEYAAFGVESIDAERPVTLDTLFQVGSVTKTLTAMAVMQLVESQAVDLNASVRDYVPGFMLDDEDVAQNVIVRQLMTHTGGWWGDYFVDTGETDDAIDRYIQSSFPSLPQISPLGRLFNYNNSGFILLGRMIELVTRQAFRDAIRQLVMQPLDLDESFFAPDDVLTRPHALGHFTENAITVLQDPLFLPRSGDPAGGLWSTARDMIRYARFHLGDDTNGSKGLLSRETLEMMQTPHVPMNDEPTTAMGMPWFISELPGLRLVTHEGGTWGQGAVLLLAPEHRFAAAIMVNTQPALALGEVLFEVLSQYLEQDPGMGQEASNAVLTAPATPSADDLAQYAGRYEVPGTSYDLRPAGGTLEATYESHPIPDQMWPEQTSDVPPELPLQFVTDDLAIAFVDGQPQPLGFVRDEDGEIGWVSAGRRLFLKTDTR